MARDRPPSPRGRRWRGEPSAPSASRQPIFRGAHPERARSRSMDGSYGSIRDGSRAGASHSGPHPSPGTLGGVPAPFAHVADSRSSAGGGRAGLGSAAGARGGRGLIAAEAEIHRLRACVRETEGRLEEERLVFSAVLEEERAAHRRWRERARERSRRGRRPLERLPGRDTHHAGNAVRSQVSRRIGHGFEPGRRRRLRRRRRDEDDARDARLDYPRREESATHDG